MAHMLTEGYWLGEFAPGDRMAECGLPAPDGGKMGQRWDSNAWVDDPKAAETAQSRLVFMAKMIAADRAEMAAARWQLIVSLGEERWAKVLAFRDSPDTTWAMRQILDEAQYIPRVSQTVDLLAYILGMTDADADALFVNALALRA